MIRSKQDHFEIMETQIQIHLAKRAFEAELCLRLNLIPVPAPLFLDPNTGLNDDLNGTERPVSFDVASLNHMPLQVVHSLAKWKRQALARYGFSEAEGLVTDMHAIRRDEVLGPLHSVHVDQWDWEVRINPLDRNVQTLKHEVEQIYKSIRVVERELYWRYPKLKLFLPKEIHFITTQELEDKWPDLTPKEREDAICKEHGAVFIMQIGHYLASGIKHDGRAPDYDDWKLNGDIVVWNPILQKAFEVSSMGIRVDAKALDRQLSLACVTNRRRLPFHKAILEDQLPQSIGGGIGQSRLCMLLLQKKHIGEVQVSTWSQETIDECRKQGISLL